LLPEYGTDPEVCKNGNVKKISYHKTTASEYNYKHFENHNANVGL